MKIMKSLKKRASGPKFQLLKLYSVDAKRPAGAAFPVFRRQQAAKDQILPGRDQNSPFGK
jgi:hypothetical protein